MKLKEIMTRDVQVIEPQMTLDQVAMKMRDLDVGMIPVCDGERLVGSVTDRDIVVKAIADGKDIRSCSARDVMSRPIRYCFEDQDTNEAADLMKKEKIRRLVVLDRNKKLVGIVALGDLAMNESENVAGDVLQKVSEPVKGAA